MPTPPPAAADRFAIIIDALCKAVAARHKSLAGMLTVLIWRRLRRTAARFATLAAHVQAGTHTSSPQPNHTPSFRPKRSAEPESMTPHHPNAGHCEHGLPIRPANRGPASEAISGRTPRPDRLPTRFAWLLRLVPEVACPRSQFCHLLSDPEIAALLAAAPQLGRILRALCRMLGIKLLPTMVPPALIPPRRPRRRKPRINLSSALPRSFSQPPSREPELSHAEPCADPAVDPESVALVEHILRWADTHPTPRPARPRRRPPRGPDLAALVPASRRFKPA